MEKRFYWSPLTFAMHIKENIASARNGIRLIRHMPCTFCVRYLLAYCDVYNYVSATHGVCTSLKVPNMRQHVQFQVHEYCTPSSPPAVPHHRHLLQTTCYRPPATTTCYRPPVTDHLLQPPATDHLLQTTCYRPPATDHLLQTTCYRPPATDHLLQTTCYNHLLLLLLLLISRKEIRRRNRAFGPSTHYSIYRYMNMHQVCQIVWRTGIGFIIQPQKVKNTHPVIISHALILLFLGP